MNNKIKACDTCGKDMAKNAKTCPQCGAKNKKPVFKRWWFWVIVVVILAGAMGSLGEDEEPRSADGASVSSREGAGSVEKTAFGVNDPAELKGIIVTFHGASENTGSTYNKPNDGNVFLICEFTFENNSDKEVNLSTLMSFASYIDGYATNLDLGAMVETDKQQLDGTVAPGKKMNGVIGLQASADWSELEIHVTPDFWGKDITFTANK